MSLQIIPLGTGAGRPTLDRGAAAVALVSDHGWTLFDCGEGTLLQIHRAGLRMSRLRMVCISHFHGDHVNGLPGLLGSMALDRCDGPLTLIGPPGLHTYLTTLQGLGVFSGLPGLSVHEIPPEGLTLSDPTCTLQALPLQHRITTFGFRWTQPQKPGRFDLDAARRLGVPQGPLYGQLQRGQPATLPDGRTVQPHEVLGANRPGKSVAYCSDTVYPCEGALALASGVDLLIHEGTYGPDFEAQAAQYGHSTTSQAASLAARAEAKRLLITHISARHGCDTNNLQTLAQQIFPPTEIARDLEIYTA